MAKKKSKAARKKTSKAKRTARKATARRAGKAVGRKTARKAARKPAKRRVAKPVRKAARKPTRTVARKKVAKKKPARKPAARAAKPREVRVKVTVPAPKPVPPPGIDLPAAPPSRPAAPPPAVAAESGPKFYEPDDLPPAGRPSGEGPFFENDRRDRPFYDTEVGGLDFDEGASEDEERGGREGFLDDDEEVGDEDEAEEEDDDPGLLAHPPPVSLGGARRAARREPPAVAELVVGAAAPEFALVDQRGAQHTLAAYRGRTVILYFYPKDDTPGCTREACGFRDALGEFDDRNAVVLGVSPDTVASHAAFSRKYGLTFPLLADPDHAVAARYGAWGEQPAPGGGRQPGIARTTIVIDEAGRIAKVYRQVQPAGHEQEVLAWLDRNRLAGG